MEESLPRNKKGIFMRPYRLPALRTRQSRSAIPGKAFSGHIRQDLRSILLSLTEPPIVTEKRQNPYSRGRKAPSNQPAQKLTLNGPPPDAEKNRQTIIWKTSFSPTHHLTRNISDISRTNKVINSIKIRHKI